MSSALTRRDLLAMLAALGLVPNLSVTEALAVEA